MTLIDILKISGIDISKKIKIIRHSNKDETVLKILTENRDLLEQYQALQDPKALHCDYVVSCIRDKKNKTIVQAVYEVKGHRPATKEDIPKHKYFNYLLENNQIENEEFTELSRVQTFEDLEQRIVIDWGKAAISWLQSLNNNPKHVIEIRAKGKIEEFLNYDNVLLNYHQLKEMIDNPEANQEWHQMLSVNGIYLMTNNKTGQQYVGSAYGKQGILGRWSDYAKNGHGGNVRLQRLLEANPTLLFDMQYSVLTTVASNKTPTEIIKIENFYKRKLGKSAVTLNHEGHSSEIVKIEQREHLISFLSQFLQAGNLSYNAPDDLTECVYKTVLTNGYSLVNKMFYAFISDDGFRELLLVKIQIENNEPVYLEIDLDGNRSFLDKPRAIDDIRFQHEHVVSQYADNLKNELNDNEKTHHEFSLNVIRPDDPKFREKLSAGKLILGNDPRENLMLEVIDQLAGLSSNGLSWIN